MNKEQFKRMIAELFQEGDLQLEVDTRRDWEYENWNDEYKIVTTIRLVSDNITIAKAGSYVTIEKQKETEL